MHNVRRMLIVLAAALFMVLSSLVLAQGPATGAGRGAGRGGGRGGTPAAPAKAPTSAVTGSAARGKQLYYTYACYSCHGYNGETGARAFVPNWPAMLATESSFITFLRARANQAPVQPSTSMPNYAAETLNDTQAKDIYAYIRSFTTHATSPEKNATMNAILANAQKPYKP